MILNLANLATLSASHLEIKNLSYKYGSSKSDGWALKDINLEISNGEIVGLLGPSGCGKTTLLRLIAGFEKPTSGSISLNGNEISNNKYVYPPERRGVGMVFQDYALFPHINVWDNVCFGIKPRNDTERAKWLLDLLGIYDLRNRYPHQISGGQRQRVALARALAPGTSLVLLDEPFCSLDVEVRCRLRNELSGVLKSCSATGVIVTHDPQEALAICDHIGVIRHGKLHQFSTPQQLSISPSTPFVGKFVLQKNILPIVIKDHKYFTPLGDISLEGIVNLQSNSTIMFDQHSISANLDSNGLALVKSKEFHLDHWILSVGIGSYNIRLKSPLNTKLNVGSKCNLTFNRGNEVVIFPANHKLRLV